MKAVDIFRDELMARKLSISFLEDELVRDGQTGAALAAFERIDDRENARLQTLVNLEQQVLNLKGELNKSNTDLANAKDELSHANSTVSKLQAVITDLNTSRAQ